MTFKKINFNKGFSIIEIIIYLAIFTIISTVVINSFIIVLASFSTIKNNQNILNSGTIAMDRMSYEIRQAKSIDVINSTFSSDTGVLCLKDESGTSCITKFNKNGNTLNLFQNNVLVGNLLASNIILNKLMFNRISTTNSEAVKIKMEIQDVHGKIETFYDTVVVRGGY